MEEVLPLKRTSIGTEERKRHTRGATADNKKT